MVADDVALLVLDRRAGATDVEPLRGVELEGVTARGGFGVAEHHADLHAQLVDENAAAVRPSDGAGQFAHCLTHQARLHPHFRVAHLAFDFRARHQGGHRIDHDQVDGTGTDQVLGDFEGLLAVVGLRNEEVFDVHAQRFGVEAIEGVFRVDERGDAALFLTLRNRVDGQRGFPRRFRAVNLDDPSLGKSVDAQGDVQTERAGGDGVHLDVLFFAESHDGAFSVGLVHTVHRHLQCFHLVVADVLCSHSLEAVVPKSSWKGSLELMSLKGSWLKLNL